MRKKAAHVSTDAATSPREWGAYAALCLFWGAIYPAAKVAVGSVGPFVLAGARFGTAALLMMVGANGLVTIGQQYIPSAHTAVLVATIPLWLLILDPLNWRAGRQRFNLTTLLGMAVGIVGVAWLVDAQLRAGSQAGEDTAQLALGYGLTIAAPAFWGVGTLVGRGVSPRLSSIYALGVQFAAGGATLLAVAAARGEWLTARWSGEVAATVFFLAIFCSFVAYLAYFFLLPSCCAAGRAPGWALTPT